MANMKYIWGLTARMVGAPSQHGAQFAITRIDRRTGKRRSFTVHASRHSSIAYKWHNLAIHVDDGSRPGTVAFPKYLRDGGVTTQQFLTQHAEESMRELMVYVHGNRG